MYRVSLALCVLCAVVPGCATPYILDTGSPLYSYGFGNSNINQLLWSNSYTIAPGAETITSVQLWIGLPDSSFGATLVIGQAFTVYMWSDNNADGIPDDGGILSSAAATITSPYTGFQTVDIPDVTLAPGQGFAVGALMTVQRQYPATLDGLRPSTPNRSYYAEISVNPNLISATPANRRGFIETRGSTLGNWLMRAGSQPVPEPTSMVTLGLGLGAVIRRKRRS